MTTRTRAFYYRELEQLAGSAAGLRVLEIGSGKRVRGEDSYSAKHLFGTAAEFRQTDRDAAYGHDVLDVTTTTIEAEYDLILCMSVLEHVYDHSSAVANLHRALRPEGRLVVAVPFVFPLHDEPHDYWRFTRHALVRMLEDFREVEIKCNGPRKLPFGLFAVARV
jgi:SAM-dependent methyltransferase